MKKTFATKIFCSVLASALVLGAFGINAVSAAKKATLKTKSVNLKIGKKTTIKIKNKKKGAKYTFKSNAPKTVSVSKKGIIKAKKTGKATITVKETIKKKTRKLGKVKVTVTDSKINPTAIPTEAPTAVPTTIPSPTATVTPSPTAAPTATPIAYPESFDTPDGFDAKSSDVTYGEVKKITYFSSVTGKSRKANVILPANYDENKEYPVVYLLHGIGGNEDEWLQGNPDAIIGNLVANGEAKEMILVSPNVRAGADDSYPSDNAFSLEHYAKFDNFINDLRDCLMPYMEDNFAIAKGRENTAIAGLSMGGRESLYIGLNMLDTFGYIAGFSPGYGVFEYTANGVSEDGLFTEETFTVPEEYRNNTFLMIIAGTNEGGIDSVGGKCHNAFNANGVNHWWYTPVGAHDFVTWKNGLYNFAKNIFK